MEEPIQIQIEEGPSISASDLNQISERQRLYWLGRGHREAGRLEEAIAAFGEYAGILDKRDRHYPWMCIAEMQLEMGQAVSAVDSYRRAALLAQSKAQRLAINAIINSLAKPNESLRDWSSFVAIDFETANELRNSACSLGIVVVDNWEVVERRSWLLRPVGGCFNPFNSALHGITEADVEDAPTLADAWEEFRPYVEGRLVVAHNASFDLSVLRNTLAAFDLPMPELETLCTLQLSRRLLQPQLRYSLEALCSEFAIPYGAHDAEADALSAALLLRYLVQSHDGDVGQVLSQMSSRRTQASAKPSGIIGDASKQLDYHPFFGKNIVFTGTLQSMTRQTAWQLVADIGGTIKEAVNKTTNYLVVGQQDDYKVGMGGRSSKQEKAASLLTEGVAIELLSEEEFLQMI